MKINLIVNIKRKLNIKASINIIIVIIIKSYVEKTSSKSIKSQTT